MTDPREYGAHATLVGVMMANDQLRVIAQNVRRLRRERGYSQSQLARHAAISKQTLSAVEAGQANPTMLTLIAIAEVLGVSPSALLTERSSLVYVRRSASAAWQPELQEEVRDLDRSFGHVRSSLIRYVRTGAGSIVHRPHRPGTVHHAYIVSGSAVIGLDGEEVEVGGGDFARFPGDVPHHTIVLSETVVLHMVTTAPALSAVATGA